MIWLLSLAMLQSTPQLVIGSPPLYRTVGDFSCDLRDEEDNSSRVSGSIVDFRNSDDGGKDAITIEVEAPEATLLSGTYFGWVDDELMVLRNWVDHDSHLVASAPLHSTLLLWGSTKRGGTLSVSAQVGDFATQNYTGLCDIEFRRERISSKP